MLARCALLLVTISPIIQASAQVAEDPVDRTAAALSESTGPPPAASPGAWVVLAAFAVALALAVFAGRAKRRREDP